ncbi:rifin PIR protein, putative [Plasmodium reichenowi]|uniref:Rifin PIR protein, putative n=1 Tax=Plasmodium reichenowi TaxID=5854 RepID=A0A2P9DHH9_PLARE|nr:rifin PIR protein, putative [Plasmodium reichenowi]
MKIHYINILLFALPLNILVNDQCNYNVPKRTPKSQITKSHRSLCECELYAPANYDCDPQMKEVMENFSKQTQQRFEEYDNRMIEKRKQCKDKCDKEIQKIILKDKLEKELMDKFATLQTDIQSDAIPTCICEKSVADKVEKGCLRCGGVLGGGIAPSVGLLGTVTIGAWINSATAAAIELATKKGIEEGIKAVITKITESKAIFSMVFKGDWSTFITKAHYDTASGLVKAVTNAMDSIGKGCSTETPDKFVCSSLSSDKAWFGTTAEAGKKAAADKIAAVKTAKKGFIDAASYEGYATVGYSVLAIIIIILIMVIIYLILRHRRKKKMKKKFQYIKLLEE